jgi:hypothetical protein
VFEMQKRLTTQITGIPDTPHNTSLYVRCGGSGRASERGGWKRGG